MRASSNPSRSDHARQRDPQDRRRAYLALTPSGRAFYDAIMPVLKNRQARMLACLTPEERKNFSETLLRLATHASDWA